MMVLTLQAVINCDHQAGIVGNDASQSWVTIEGVPVLVAVDPENRPITSCPNLNPLTGQAPCKQTLKVQQGYSQLGTIDGRRICLDTVTGLTDGSPPGLFKYTVRTPGQNFVGSTA